MSFSRQTGKMTLSLVGKDVAFVLSGSCTPQ
jgi:hypothetical protein